MKLLASYDCAVHSSHCRYIAHYCQTETAHGKTVCQTTSTVDNYWNSIVQQQLWACVLSAHVQ